MKSLDEEIANVRVNFKNTFQYWERMSRSPNEINSSSYNIDTEKFIADYVKLIKDWKTKIAKLIETHDPWDDLLTALQYETDTKSVHWLMPKVNPHISEVDDVNYKIMKLAKEASQISSKTYLRAAPLPYNDVAGTPETYTMYKQLYLLQRNALFCASSYGFYRISIIRAVQPSQMYNKYMQEMLSYFTEAIERVIDEEASLKETLQQEYKTLKGIRNPTEYYFRRLLATYNKTSVLDQMKKLPDYAIELVFNYMLGLVEDSEYVQEYRRQVAADKSVIMTAPQQYMETFDEDYDLNKQIRKFQQRGSAEQIKSTLEELQTRRERILNFRTFVPLKSRQEEKNMKIQECTAKIKAMEKQIDMKRNELQELERKDKAIITEQEKTHNEDIDRQIRDAEYESLVAQERLHNIVIQNSSLRQTLIKNQQYIKEIDIQLQAIDINRPTRDDLTQRKARLEKQLEQAQQTLNAPNQKYQFETTIQQNKLLIESLKTQLFWKDVDGTLKYKNFYTEAIQKKQYELERLEQQLTAANQALRDAESLQVSGWASLNSLLTLLGTFSTLDAKDEELLNTIVEDYDQEALMNDIVDEQKAELEEKVAKYDALHRQLSQIVLNAKTKSDEMAALSQQLSHNSTIKGEERMQMINKIEQLANEVSDLRMSALQHRNMMHHMNIESLHQQLKAL